MKSYLFASLITILLLQFSSAFSADKPLQGQAKLDSLLAELPNAKGDTNEVKLLNNISFEYKNIDPKKGIEYGKKGLKFSKQLKWKKGTSTSFNLIAVNNAIKSDYKKALEYFKKALKTNEEIGDKKGVASNLGNIGIVYKNQSDYPKALENYQKALKISEELDNKFGIADDLSNIGVIYDNLSNYPKALEYYKKALKMNKDLDRKGRIAKNLGNIGAVYAVQSEYYKALVNYRKALNINEELDYKAGQAINLGNIGLIYKDKSNYFKSLEYYHKALKIHEEQEWKLGIAVTLRYISELYFSLSRENLSISQNELNQFVSLDKEVNLNNSIENSLEAISIFKEIGELEYRSNTIKTLADAYKQKGEMEKAYEALEEHHRLKDSVFNQENTDKIAALEKAREDDLKQKEIEKQKLKIAEQEKREKLILYFSIGFIIVMAIVMFIIYRLLKRSDKLLYNVLPVSIAKRLKNKEHPISDYFTQASIVFIDIVNFTEMAKDEDPRRVVEALNKIFTHYDTIANKYGLEKIKTIGDSYMAAAGIPEVQKDNTHRAAKMALEVKQLMSDYRTADGTKIEVRIGLDCGPVVAGVIGENKFIYDMWSDAVNTASRMETSSEAGQVHITDRFKEAVSEYAEFEYVERGEIEIKGKGMMKTYYIQSKEVANV